MRPQSVRSPRSIWCADWRGGFRPDNHGLFSRSATDRGGLKVERKTKRDILGGTAPDRLADAAGAELAGGSEKQEIGAQALTPEDVQAVKQDLKANPPQQFDIARALRVFNSEVQYVDLNVEEYRLSREAGCSSARPC